jgi:peptide/nickel transport system permease protein
VAHHPGADAGWLRRRRARRRYYHILGTDKVGEDVFYQSLKSIRTGLVIGTLTTLVMLPAAVILGIMAGYFRG